MSAEPSEQDRARARKWNQQWKVHALDDELEALAEQFAAARREGAEEAERAAEAHLKRLTTVECELEEAERRLAEAEKVLSALREASGSDRDMAWLQIIAALQASKDRERALREALRLTQDALTDAERYHAARCSADKPHDHALLRKIRAHIRSNESALAASQPEEQP